MATTYDPLGGYATNPGTQSGSGAYGAVPGALTIPPNVYEQLTSLDPGLFGDTGSLPQSIKDEFLGLSPETISSYQQNAGQFGSKSGMPGSQFAGNYGLTQLGLGVEAQHSKAIQDAMSYAKLTGSQLTPQETALEVASRNATMASAPNPTAAANQQMQDWQSKFNAAAGGGAGGVRAPNPAGGSGMGALRSQPSGEDQSAAYSNQVLNSPAFQSANAANYAEQNRARQWATQQGQIPIYGSSTTNEDDGLTAWLASMGYDSQGNELASDGGFGYQPTSQGTMWMGQNTTTQNDQSLNDWLASMGYDTQGNEIQGYTYMGQNPDNQSTGIQSSDEELNNWLSFMGYDSQGNEVGASSSGTGQDSSSGTSDEIPWWEL